MILDDVAQQVGQQVESWMWELDGWLERVAGVFAEDMTVGILSGKEVEKKNMNYNQFFKTIKEFSKKSERNHMTEYHYLVVNKNDGNILLKSILDIHTFKTNPSNDLQINWTNEFKNSEYTCADFKLKIQELLKAIQTSVKQAMLGMKEFADADIDKEFS